MSGTKGRHTWVARDEYPNADETVLYKAGEKWTVYEDRGKNVLLSVAENVARENAPLIAAAPELADCAEYDKDAFDHILTWGDLNNHQRNWLTKAVNRIEKAIAKAGR